MNVSSVSVAAYGSAAIASAPANDASVKRDDGPTESSPAQQIIDAAKSMGTGQVVDKKV